jgi:hypothetical protein
MFTGWPRRARHDGPAVATVFVRDGSATTEDFITAGLVGRILTAPIRAVRAS